MGNDSWYQKTYRAVQVIRNQGGGSPPLLAIFQNWGGGGGEFFSKIISFMTHFGLIKLESSNLLDITNSVTINIPTLLYKIHRILARHRQIF